MRKVIILIPVFNDWECLEKLIEEINENVKNFQSFSFELLVVNDGSSISQPILTKPHYIKSLQILNMRENRGHARCNAFGIRYIFKNKEFDYLILMDGDGEDRPVEIMSLIQKITEEPGKSVVAKRVQRSEGRLFQFLYKVHKIVTLFFTGKNINFGNYSILTKIDVGKIHSKASLWSSYSGTIKKNLNILNEINSIRGSRYFGPSKMSLPKLLLHSFSIIAVFKYQVFFRTLFLILALAFIKPYIGNLSIFSQISLAIFNLTILIVSLREKENALINSHNNLKDMKNITH